ncbi:MAG TPA: VWA domain-containing protein [Terracidiphilus sp.]
MRKLIVLAMAACLAAPADAARRLTVAQLAETLATALAQHHNDQDIARQVGGLELSERLTAATLDRFAAKLPLQPRTALALQLLADQSEFLELPAGEQTSAAPPSLADQENMLAAARAYAVETWGRLPNFFASRVTTRFDNTAQVLHAGEFAVREGLHPVNSSTRRITFRDGKEVLDTAVAPTAPGTAKGPSDLGLRSWGEFGPALTVVLADLASRKLAFSHWEQTAGGVAAVYRYEVPREASHYLVTYSFRDLKVRGRTQFGYGGRQRSPQQVANIPRESELETFHETPSYHGSIAIDPGTGAVLRITIEANLGRGDPLLRASTMIEYGPVMIGDRKFICPLRSLAISLEPSQFSGCGKGGSTTLNGVGDLGAWQSPTTGCDNTPVLLINETKFGDYHRLGSTARIVSDAAQAGNPEPGTPLTAPASANPVPAPEAIPSSQVQAPPQPQPQLAASAGAHPEPAPPLSPANPAPPPEPVLPEISLTDTAHLPDAPANAPPAQDSGYSIKVTTRLVDVGVIAYDKKGRPVMDLNGGDFEVYDNGRKQDIRSFTPAPAAAPAPAPSSPPANAEPSFSNRAPDAVTPSGVAIAPDPGATGATAAPGATILLIDESHIAWPDFSYARGQMLQFLGKVSPAERIGLYSMTGTGFRVVVEPGTDHAALAARLKAFTPSALSLAQAQEEESRNRQQINEVHNLSDLNSVNGNRNDVPDASEPVDPQLMSMGDNPARSSLVILAQVARHLASIPGHKSLVWVSTDNVLGDWQDQQVGIDKSPKESQAFAVRVQEAMNDAHTSVYPFDVSQLEGGAIAADIQHRNVELTPAAADNAATAASAGGPAAGGRNMQPGRITAQMNQDLHPIQGSIRDVATATGGRIIRRSGELATALAGIVDDGRAIYQLSFSPQGAADDQYHSITVKLTGRRGVSLRYRTGYVFAREPATLKDRFQAAVWRPVDTREIGVSAHVVPGSTRTQVKLNIAANDLAMVEGGGRWMDRLDIFFIQRDDAGLHAHVEGQTLGLQLKSSTYQNILPTGVPFEHGLELRPGMTSLRVLVVDENSGRIGSVTIPSAAMKTQLP